MGRRKLGICIDCGTAISRKSNKRCRKCYAVSRRNDPNIDRKTYARNWRIKKKYGLDPDGFFIYWMAQRGRCFICDKEMKMPLSRRGQCLDTVAIDHDHGTGKVRALLCNSCNKGLGYFRDNISFLRKAAKYLEDTSNG